MRVGRLDEGAADIVVADDAEIEGDARGLGEADRGRHAGIGHRHDDVGGGRRLARELRADPLAHLVDAGALDDRIGAGEIDVLEDAEARAAPARTGLRDSMPSLGDDDHLARLDLAHEPRADDVERAGLGGEHRRAVEIAEQQRAHAERIAAADQLLLGQRDQRDRRPRSAAARRSCARPAAPRSLVAIRWRIVSVSEVDWKIEPRRCSLRCKRAGVGDVAVMGDGEAAAGELGEERLHVAQVRAAGGRIAVMADGAVALEPLHHRRLGEVVADQADMALAAELLAVEGDDAGRLLAAVLQRVQAERGQRAPLRDGRKCRRRRTPRAACRRRRGATASPAFASPQSAGGASICRSSSFWSSGA